MKKRCTRWRFWKNEVVVGIIDRLDRNENIFEWIVFPENYDSEFGGVPNPCGRIKDLGKAMRIVELLSEIYE